MHREETQQLLYRILSTEQQKRLEVEPADRPLVLGLRRRAGSASTSSSSGAPSAPSFRLIPHKILTLEELGLPDRPARARRAPARPRARHRADRLGQVDDARRDDRRDQPHARGAHPDDRGPDRVPPPPPTLPRQPARGRHRRARLRRGAARRAPPGPRRDPGRRDARPRDDLDRADRGRDGPPRLRARCTRAARPRRSTASSTSSRRSSRTRCARSSPQRSRASSRQTLLPTADGRGRVAATEILIPDYAVRNLIREAQARADLLGHADGHGRGMQTMEQSLAELVLRGTVTHGGRARGVELPGPAARVARALGLGSALDGRCVRRHRPTARGRLRWQKRTRPRSGRRRSPSGGSRSAEPEGARPGGEAGRHLRLEEGNHLPAQAEAGGSAGSPSSLP